MISYQLYFIIISFLNIISIFQHFFLLFAISNQYSYNFILFLNIIYIFYNQMQDWSWSDFSKKQQSQVEIQHSSEYQNNINNKQFLIQLPQAKQLIQFSRPLDFKSRMLLKDDNIYQLPWELQNAQQYKLEIKQKNIQMGKSQQKKKRVIGPNIKGMSLYEYFNGQDFIQIYKRYKYSNQKGTDFDLTSKIKIIQSSHDYNQKLFKRLKHYNNQQQELFTHDYQFNSKFQSGNLALVYKHIKTQQYYLLLQNDTNTHGFNHWFFYSIRNKNKNTINIHIFNMIKKSSLHTMGMKIAIFSLKSYLNQGKGWIKGGQNINYIKTKIQRPNKQNQFFYSLTFQYSFEKQQDTVFFALNIPYTYTKLNYFLQNISQKFRNSNILFLKKALGYTLANNAISSLIIKNHHQSQKKAILILARQHPGQTVSSFVAEGIIEYLSQRSHQVNFLLKKYKFIILPMMNPDGVIYGNSRCNLSGLDLNRQWGQQIFKQLTPQTYIIKKYIKTLNQSNGIQCMIDLHGHSKKMNSFFYGCPSTDKVKMRLFSILMSKTSNFFDMNSCNYRLQKYKMNTIRWQLNSIGVSSYTLQNSYHGKYNGTSNQSYTNNDLRQIGHSIIKSLYYMYTEDQKQFNKKQIMEQIQKNILYYELNQNKGDSGSQSDPDGDLLDNQQRIKTLRLNNVNNPKIITNLNNISKVKIQKQYPKKIFKLNFQNTIKSDLKKQLQKTIQIAKDNLIKGKRIMNYNKMQTKSLVDKQRNKSINEKKLKTTVQLSKKNYKFHKFKSQVHFDNQYQKQRKRSFRIPFHTETSQRNSQQIQKKKQIDLEKQTLQDNMHKKKIILEDENDSQKDIKFIQSFYIKNRKQRPAYLPVPNTLPSRKVSRSRKRIQKVLVNLEKPYAQKFLRQSNFHSKVNFKSRNFMIQSNNVFYQLPIL